MKRLASGGELANKKEENKRLDLDEKTLQAELKAYTTLSDRDNEFAKTQEAENWTNIKTGGTLANTKIEITRLDVDNKKLKTLISFSKIGPHFFNYDNDICKEMEIVKFKPKIKTLIAGFVDCKVHIRMAVIIKVT